MQKETQQSKSNRALQEEATLSSWKEKDIFNKTLKKESPKGDFVFYEGPPTANAKPALHHLEARAFKDVIPRYKTMQGFSVRRKAGWDTHGLPVELQIEKKLGLTSKKQIEEYGIAKFNKECKESVFTYIKDWEDFTDRIGYWVNKEDAYYTFNSSYIESLWNIVGRVNDQGLLYKDYKVVPWCPRCGTALASHELAQGYMDVKDLSVTAKFKVMGVENTYILAWTTTPWTLPGNVALAVGEKIDYVYIKKDDQTLILAKERLSIIDGDYMVIEEVKGTSLVGIQYEPLYPYLQELIDDKEKLSTAYKIYAADFVTTTDGTGVVHTAVMYGQDDFELGTKIGLPKLHTVDLAGHFIKGTDFLEGRFVKDEEVAIDIIKNLAHRGLLFKKEKYEHSYPHCWRCKTPLIYYARDSWYIQMSKLRDQLVTENEKINWEPAHIQQGRFGEWLREIKDWAISRERYWGTPLPLWIAEDGERLVVDSVKTLKQYTKTNNNKFFVMRHAQTEANVKKIWNCSRDVADVLTKEGEKDLLASIEILKNKNIDLIVYSPFSRTEQTAKIAAAALGVPESHVIVDERIGEWQVGKAYDGKQLDAYFAVRNKEKDRYRFKTTDGESYVDILRRSGDVLYDLEKNYSGKNILVISHGAVTRAMELIAEGYSLNTMFARTREYKNFQNAEVREISFAALPHNDDFELDLHRPYIDEVLLVKDGKEFKRVKEVMDVWFDSGAMPFAQDHYPFENKAWIDGPGYPADFISEAIDQTRGWFYTLHAVGALMGKGRAYKNVICLGHLLDKEGKKMSKSVGNIVDPWEQMDKFGVDALRFWMYSVNQPGDSKNYDEKTVDEIVKKVFLILENTLKFYELYKNTSHKTVDPYASENILDIWILARLNNLVEIVTNSLNSYKLFEPTRAIKEFVTDFSTWYVRRSRDRFKDDSTDANYAGGTIAYVLLTLAKLLAPFTPFFAEHLYLALNGEKESVHLEDWPRNSAYHKEVIEKMEATRALVTQGLEARQKAGIKVRQPLQTLQVKNLALEDDYLSLVRDEVNVKEVVAGTEEGIVLDTTITETLKEEGMLRELMRYVQDTRKELGLVPEDKINVAVFGETNFVRSAEEEFKKVVGATLVSYEANEGTTVDINGTSVTVLVVRHA